ncbi:MAG TPA: enoyl-CoA hydratase/isomerase family protein [Solirubrobacteraceae bacterium]|nr:enoyl-CoA hydratase/isomerase family protein [Solirubrobacteraceae bacterium]
MSHDQVEFELRDGVGWLTIRRPEAKNALTKAMYAAIRDVCRQAWLDDSILALVISGSDGAFVTGGDLKEMLALLESEDQTALLAYEEFLPFEALRILPKPTVAVVDGLCMGGGLTLMSLCDIAIATTSSKFAMPEAKVGIVDGHMPRLFRDRVPSALLRYWLYTGTSFSAAEAYAAGMLTKVVEPEQLTATTEQVLRELRASSPGAISLYKQTLNETRTVSGMQDAFVTMMGEDARARLAAFSERSKSKR